ncbi:hypothetical protein [[Ruminococcus] torques]
MAVPGDNTGGTTVEPPVVPDGGTDSGGGQTEAPPGRYSSIISNRNRGR